MPVCDVIVSTISRILRSVTSVVIIILNVLIVGDHEHDCVASPSAESFLETSQCTGILSFNFCHTNHVGCGRPSLKTKILSFN